MKAITDYIKNNRYDYIDKEILEHVYIEYNFTRNFLHNLDSIFEAEGGFKNDYNIAKTINNIILKSNSNEINIDKDDFECNVFFDEIKIHVNDEINCEAEYVIDREDEEDYNNIRWDNANKRFRFIELIVKEYDDNHDYSSELMHELTHAYHDYQYLKNNKASLAKRYENSYYQKITNEKPKSFEEGILRAILYIIDKEEQDALISNVKNIFLGKKFNTYSEAIDWLNKNSILYLAIKNAKNNVDRIVSLKDKKYIDIYRDIVNSNKSDDKLFEELRSKFYKFWKKFCNHIGNMISIRLESSIKTTPQADKKRLLEVLSYEKV